MYINYHIFIMDQHNNPEVTLSKEDINKEKDEFSCYIKRENDCENFYNQRVNDEKNSNQTTMSNETVFVKNKGAWENVAFDTSISHESTETKEEHIKFEPGLDIRAADPHSIDEDSPSVPLEFVEVQYLKMKEYESVKEGDICEPFKINEDTFMCNYCKRGFTSAEYCQKHIKRCRARINNLLSTSASVTQDKKPRPTNEEEKLYHCDKCDSKFKSNSGLYQHSRKHSGVGLHTCTQCHKQCPNRSELARHMLIHTGERPHKCGQCEAAFNTAGYLKRHMLIHIGTKPHKCTQCGQSFIQASDLTIHLRTHTGERPYQCTQCSKGFIKSSDLKTHMRIHTGEKPYQCTVCNQAFVQSCNLRTHMKIHLKKTEKKP